MYKMGLVPHPLRGKLRGPESSAKSHDLAGCMRVPTPTNMSKHMPIQVDFSCTPHRIRLLIVGYRCEIHGAQSESCPSRANAGISESFLPGTGHTTNQAKRHYRARTNSSQSSKVLSRLLRQLLSTTPFAFEPDNFLAQGPCSTRAPVDAVWVCRVAEEVADGAQVRLCRSQVHRAAAVVVALPQPKTTSRESTYTQTEH